MYKILLADDEGIVIDALQFIIQKNFPGQCELAFASTGRALVERAEEFRPDIAFIDIQMPGINGIEAMRRIRERNSQIIFIILSAYNDFDYAKEAIQLGAMEYMNKPIDKDEVVRVLGDAMQRLDDDREKRKSELIDKERLELATPMMESGLIHAMLARPMAIDEVDNYLTLLNIKENRGNIMVLRLRDKQKKEEGDTEATQRFQSCYEIIRQTISRHFSACIGAVNGDMIVSFIPCRQMDEEHEYAYRVSQIEAAREVVHSLEDAQDLHVQITFGNYQPIDKSYDSYNEALVASRGSRANVVHINDLPRRAVENDYPIKIEDEMFNLLRDGNIQEMLIRVDQFYHWMTKRHGDDLHNIQLKVLELVLRAETVGYETGGGEYVFTSRSTYLKEVTDIEDYNELYAWFRKKMTDACELTAARKGEREPDIFEKAKNYINQKYKKDISLDEMSKRLGVSPYYFSRQFKKRMGISFVEYLTEVRIEHAKELLRDTDLAMKEISLEAGYTDQNYFSRTFRRQVGMSPTEYRASHS